MRNKIGIFIENRFIEKEIIYYKNRFKENDFEVVFFTRLWGQSKLTFKGIEFGMEITVDKSFENLTQEDLKEFAAIIMPAGYVSDYFLYSEKPKDVSPAVKLVKKVMNDKSIVKGFICHALWIAAPIKKVFRNRVVTCHNNLIAYVENLGMTYVDKDVRVDEDIVTARTGEDYGVFAKSIIQTIEKRK